MKLDEARKIFMKGGNFRLKKDKPYSLMEIIETSLAITQNFNYANGYLEGGGDERKRITGLKERIIKVIDNYSDINLEDCARIKNELFDEFEKWEKDI